MRGLSIWPLILLSACLTNMAGAEQKSEMNNVVRVDVNIGVIYDEDNWGGGGFGFLCIRMALSAFYESLGHYKTRKKLNLHTRFIPKNSIIGEAAAGITFIHYSNEGNNWANKFHGGWVCDASRGESSSAVFAYLATSPFLSCAQTSHFIRMTQDDLLQVKPTCALVKAFGWREVVPVYQIDACIPYHGTIHLVATDEQIHKELHKLNVMHRRVFMLYWILTTGIPNILESLDDIALEPMQGALGLTTYVPEMKALKAFKTQWGREFGDMKLDIKELWAYEAGSQKLRP
ncbi:hypothetical protein Cgig2_032200 [Carnegiea gigantea]|uniref:Receptor ligand binding region domain-containing protein n=1 Tax=Carnegiea gigantea TaxID=171969 RepID=A0A9Q1QC94_9CARY|nr:hypothetical protein Cgig2_032200 [Carnegiea gigantea]